jgi:hypothetical protein
MKALIQIFFLSLLTFSTLAQSDSLQVDSTKVEVEEDEIDPSWEKSFGLGLSLSHSLNVNAPANSAPKEGFSSTVSIDASLNYIKEKSRFKMLNELSWTMALYKANGQSPIQTTSDIFLSNHDFSYSFKKGGNWRINTIFNVETSVLTLFENNYLYDQNALGPIQSFLNPYSITISPGIKYTINKSFEISVSPYVLKINGVTSQTIADKDLFFQDKDNRIQSDGHYKKSFQDQLGAGLQIWYKKQFGKWLAVNYKIIANSNYLENIFKNGTLTGQFTTNLFVYKGFGITHKGLLKGNFAQSPFKPFYNQVIVLSYKFAK